MIGRGNKLKTNIFASFVIAFLVISSVFFILRSQGTQIKNNGTLVRTSVIRVTSVPSDVNAYIDGVKVDIKDKLIQNLEIGTVTLTLEKDGYSTWSKTVEVQSGVVTDVSAQLYPEELLSTQVATQPIDQIIYDANTNEVFYSVIDSELPSEIGIWKLKLEVGALDLDRNPKPQRFITFTNETLSQIKEFGYEISLSNDSESIMLHINELDLYRIIKIDSSEITFLDTLLGYTPDKVEWGSSFNELIITDGDFVTIFNLEENSKSVLSSNQDGTKSYCASKEDYFVINTDLNEVERLKNHKFESIEEIPVRSLNIDSNSKIFCTLDNDIFILSTIDGIFYIDSDKSLFTKVSSGGEVVSVSNDGSSFIFTSDNEFFAGSINLRNPSELVVNKFRFEMTEDIESIRYSNNSEKLIIEKTSEYEIRDFDGKNPISLFDSEMFLTNSLEFLSDNGAAYIALDSAISGETNTYTLYKIEFK